MTEVTFEQSAIVIDERMLRHDECMAALERALVWRFQNWRREQLCLLDGHVIQCSRCKYESETSCAPGSLPHGELDTVWFCTLCSHIAFSNPPEMAAMERVD